MVWSSSTLWYLSAAVGQWFWSFFKWWTHDLKASCYIYTILNQQIVSWQDFFALDFFFFLNFYNRYIQRTGSSDLPSFFPSCCIAKASKALKHKVGFCNQFLPMFQTALAENMLTLCTLRGCLSVLNNVFIETCTAKKAFFLSWCILLQQIGLWKEMQKYI